MAQFETTCGACQAKLKLKDASARGKKVRCPKCGASFTARASSSDGERDAFSFDDDEFNVPAAAGRLPPRTNQRKATTYVPIPGRSNKGNLNRSSHRRIPRGWVYLAASGVAAILVALGVVLIRPDRKTVRENVEMPAKEIAPAAAEPQVRLPDPIQLPDWLLADAPFDAKSFWITVPREENAAALYLDAFYEFHPHVEIFFPEDVRARRTPVVQKRGTRSLALQVAWYNPNAPKDTAERDAVIEEHAAGFEKLELAQKRPRCCFDFGIDATTLLRVAVSAREVVRVAGLEIERDMEAGRLEPALKQVAQCLRMSRDLCVRAPGLQQALARALEAGIFESLRKQLRSPAMTPEFLDKLMVLLAENEESLRRCDPFLTRLRADYLRSRLLVHQVVERSGEFSEAKWRTAYGGRFDTLAEAALVAAIGDLDFISDGSRASLKQQAETPLAAAVFQQAGLRQLQREDAFLSDWYRQYESHRGERFDLRVQAEREAQQKVFGNDSKILPDQAAEKIKSGEISFPISQTFLGQSYMTPSPLAIDVDQPTRRSAFRALVALRKWQLQHREPPTAMADLFPGVPRDQLPRDYFAGETLRIMSFSATTVVQRIGQNETFPAGETVIYSVGADAVDDQARILALSANGDEKGDLVFAIYPVLQ